jgi:cell wall-associated NlpC family hydrolase
VKSHISHCIHVDRKLCRLGVSYKITCVSYYKNMDAGQDVPKRRRGLPVVASEPLPKIFVDSAAHLASLSGPAGTTHTTAGTAVAIAAATTGATTTTTTSRRKLSKRQKQKEKRRQSQEQQQQQQQQQQRPQSTSTTPSTSTPTPSTPTLTATATTTAGRGATANVGVRSRASDLAQELLDDGVEDAAIRVAAAQTGVSPRVIRKLMQKRGVTVQSLLQQFGARA